MSDLDLEALRARVAQLEAMLAPSAPPPPLPPIGYEAEVRVTQHISTLVGSPDMTYLHRDIREVRRLIYALALTYGVDAPIQHVPKLWVGPLRRLAASKAAGLTWRAALTKEGLGVPTDLEARSRALSGELDDLWDQFLPVVAIALETANDVASRRLKGKLEKLFT